MCCKLCANYSKKCHSLIIVRLHPVAETLIPAPHYHLCRGPDQPCNFQCKVCGRLIRETCHLPANQSLFGCCHRCAQYAGCDFLDKHLKAALGESAQPHDAAAAAAPRPEPAAAAAKSSSPAVAKAMAAKPAEPRHGGERTGAVHPPGRLRILLADDNATFLESAVEFLAHDPALEVFGAADGTQAVHLMNRFCPDLAVLDIVMPGMNGFEVCRTIRQSANAEATRVVLLTAYASQSMAEQAKSCGADLCVAKPIQLQDLKSRILSLVRAPAAEAARGPAAAVERETMRLEPTEVETMGPPAALASVAQAPPGLSLSNGSPVRPSPPEAAVPLPPGAAARLPLRLLLVDDDVSFLEGLAEFFRASPEVFEVRTAKTGGGALELFNNFKPHVVILDLFLPEMSGFKVCQAIRHSELSPATRILVVTGAASATAFQTAKLSGADACLSKPVHLNRLRDEAWRLGQEILRREVSPPA